MNHIRILQRAFDITRFYRVLWIFGILLALTTANPSNPGSGNNGVQFEGNGNPSFEWPKEFPNIPAPSIEPGVVSGVIGILVAVLCVVLILAVLFTIVRYVSHTAVIRMGSEFEATGEKRSFRQGWRLGWSRAAFRAWLADLLIGIAGFLFVILTLAIVAAPQLLWLTQNETLGIIGVVITVGLFFLAVLLWILVFSVVSIWQELSYRAIAIEDLGVMDGLRRGWGLFRRHLGDVIIMGLILFGIGLVLGVLGIIVFFLLGMVGLVTAGIPALLAGGITNIFAHGGEPWLAALLVGLPILILVVGLPLLFLQGLYIVFTYNVWTLAFRELLALEATQPPAAPAPVSPAPVPPAPEDEEPELPA